MKSKYENLYVITGGPGVGKTTLIEKLNAYGFQVVKEEARRIIKEQAEKNKDGVPWKQKELYAELMLDASLMSYDNIISNGISAVTFFDRGILDTICYMEMEQIPLSNETVESAVLHPYNQNVFILPPWKEIYKTDNERKQNWEEAELTFNQMKQTYLKYGYNVIEVPKAEIGKRAEFIIQFINKL